MKEPAYIPAISLMEAEIGDELVTLDPHGVTVSDSTESLHRSGGTSLTLSPSTSYETLCSTNMMSAARNARLSFARY